LPVWTAVSARSSAKLSRLIRPQLVLQCPLFCRLGFPPVSVVFVAASQLPTPFGVFTMHGFLDQDTGKEHVALTLGDALFSLRCDCGFQLEAALRAIADEGRGVLLYLRQEGRGIGLLNKIRAYELQDAGADTVEANERLGFAPDMRDYAICLPMLEHLGIGEIKLMTNNPRKVKALQGFGIRVAERKPLQIAHNPHNRKYLATKAGKLGHMLGEIHQGEAEQS